MGAIKVNRHEALKIFELFNGSKLCKGLVSNFKNFVQDKKEFGCDMSLGGGHYGHVSCSVELAYDSIYLRFRRYGSMSLSGAGLNYNLSENDKRIPAAITLMTLDNIGLFHLSFYNIS